jgi:hypothetical protein
MVFVIGISNVRNVFVIVSMKLDVRIVKKAIYVYQISTVLTYCDAPCLQYFDCDICFVMEMCNDGTPSECPEYDQTCVEQIGCDACSQLERCAVPPPCTVDCG